MSAGQIMTPALLSGFKKRVRNTTKQYLPVTALKGIQKTLRPLRSARLRLEAIVHPERFLEDPFPSAGVRYARPEDINYWGTRPRSTFNVHRDRGRVLDGDWDLHRNELRIDQTSFYVSYEMRMNGAAWNETPYYRWVLNKIEQGEVQWNCRTAAEFDGKCAEWDGVFKSIRTEGYIAGKSEDEVSINIDRGGRPLLNDGYHRLVLARLLRVPKIPVDVIVRHRQWHDFKRELYDFSQSGRHSHRGKLYAPLLHPDLQSFPSEHGHERFEIIRPHIHGQKILDIGAHLGYFCHRFEELGYDCIAVESHADIVYFLRKLHTAQERKFRIVEESIFSFMERERPAVDTVLALSILHHFLKDEDSYRRLIRMLNTLKTKEIIFEPHHVSEPQMAGAYRNFGTDEFAKFILENSGLSRAEKIGTAQDGREIFRLS